MIVNKQIIEFNFDFVLDALKQNNVMTIESRDIINDKHLAMIYDMGFKVDALAFRGDDVVYVFSKQMNGVLSVPNKELQVSAGEQIPMFPGVPMGDEQSASKRFMFKTAIIKLGVLEETVDDWLKVRKTKKCSNTETAFKMIKKHLTDVCREHGVMPQDAITVCVLKNWGGLEFDFFTNIDWESYGITPRRSGSSTQCQPVYGQSDNNYGKKYE